MRETIQWMWEGSVDVGGFSRCGSIHIRAYWKIQWEGDQAMWEGSVDVGGFSGCGEGLGCSLDEGGLSGRRRIQWMRKGSVDGGGGGVGIHWPPRVSNGSHSPWSYTLL